MRKEVIATHTTRVTLGGGVTLTVYTEPGRRASLVVHCGGCEHPGYIELELSTAELLEIAILLGRIALGEPLEGTTTVN